MDSNVNISGIIYIDLNMVILKICQVKGEKISIVEYLEYPLNLGNDTFSTGKISFDKVSELISTLNNFISVLKDYHIKRYTIIATADLKEAVNKEYIFDQIILKTGHRVNILEDSIEKAYIYKEIYRQYRNHPDYSQSKSLIVYIGTGSVKVLYHEESLIRFTRDIQIGSIKLSEILSDIQDHTNNFHIVLKEYLNSFIDILNQLIPTKSIQTFIATGRLFKVVARMCNIQEKNNTFIIHSDDLKQLFNKIKDLSPKQLQDEYHLSNYQAEVILPALIIYIKLLNLTHVESIISPIITVYDSILREMLFSNEIPEMEQEIKKNTIASAKSLAEIYKYDQEHSEVVENFSLMFFDKLKNIHGMDDRDRLLLQIAAILHDIGKFISIK
ncbi:MAG: hypothetical protein MJA31_20470, partial [Clostridia bacterium]|nr:hypothetical protein [Clostridia bacterium]